MKWMANGHTLELTARNITALADKLDDPLSARTLVSPCGRVMVQAIEDTARTATSVAAAGSERVVLMTRSDLTSLAAGQTVATVCDITVVPVADMRHYAVRAPGAVFMPTSGEYR